jgi:hypothetical protein
MRDDERDGVARTRASGNEAELLAVSAQASADDVVAAVRNWIDAAVPAAWLEAGRRGGPAAVRQVRSRAEYEAWRGLEHMVVSVFRPNWLDAWTRSSVRSTWVVSTRSGSTWLRPPSSRTGPRSSDFGFFLRSCGTRRPGASSSVSQGPGPTSHHWPPGQSVMEMIGSSRDRRCGPHGRISRIGPCCWPGPMPTCPSGKGLRTS